MEVFRKSKPLYELYEMKNAGESIPGRSDMCKGPVAHRRNGKKVV